MKKLLLSLLLCSSLFSVFAQNEKRVFKLPAYVSTKDYLPNKLIVKLKESALSQNKVSSVQSLIGLGSSKIEQKFPQNSKKNNITTFRKIENKYGLNRIYELTLPEGADIEKSVNELLKNDAVEYAEPAYVCHTSLNVPNDALYSQVQQYLNQIAAPQAWSLLSSTRQVILAIVDSGGELGHSDLAGNIYYNTSDPAGNNIDDDGDGYVDNFKGWDFVGESSSNIIEDNDPNATSGDHGIHVSGIASAVTNNGNGVASVAYNSAKLMIIKAASDNDGNTIVRGYEGIKYAADHGAKIINCSWGGDSGSFFGQDIVNYALAKDCLIIAAAGNDGSGKNLPQYPSAYEGVIAVANVQSDDSKNSNSNFGYYVSLAAPGTSIYSTVLNNSYASKTGTSMAAPVVASAAALVKSYFPGFNMQQIGEQLRVTADNIDAKNPNYVNQLGRGRLNVYRALTESSPSIKQQKITLVDKGQGTIPAGDTLTIFVDLKNFLFPVSNLQVTLTSNDEDVQVTQAIQTVAGLGSLETKENIGPFKVYIRPSAIDNQSVEFRLNYSANGTYHDNEGFVVIVSRDFLNMRSNTIATTVTSKGLIGFLKAGDENGPLGFRYKDNQLLFEAALMVGNSATKVSNNARTTDEETDEHFVKQVRVKGTVVADTIKAIAEFDDSASPNPLNIRVKHRAYVVQDGTNSSSLINEFEVINQNTTELKNVFVGLFTDWDIDGGATNATQYDAANKLAYVYDKKNTSLPFAGVKMLGGSTPGYYPLSNRLAGNILENDEFTIEEKYRTLSNGIALPGLGLTQVNGLDVSLVSSLGPYVIKPGQSITAAFALVGGDNLENLKENAASSAVIYEKLKTNIPEEVITEEVINSYPNPIWAGKDSRVMFSLKERKTVSLDLYNMQGQLVKQLISNKVYERGSHDELVDLKEIANGFYFYRLKANNSIITRKITIMR